MDAETKARFHAAAKAVAEQMVETGAVPADLKERFESVYGPIYRIDVSWGQPLENGWHWKALREVDFVTEYPDSIRILLSREAA